MTDPQEAPVASAMQIVALNLARARERAGWTQAEAGQRLEQFLGRRWSQASWSAAERAVDNKRERNFDADELLAFSQMFKLPVAWFFLPPGREGPDFGRTTQIVFTAAQWGSVEGTEDYSRRFAELLDVLALPVSFADLAFDQVVYRLQRKHGLDELSHLHRSLASLLDAIERATEATW